MMVPILCNSAFALYYDGPSGNAFYTTISTIQTGWVESDHDATPKSESAAYCKVRVMYVVERSSNVISDVSYSVAFQPQPIQYYNQPFNVSRETSVTETYSASATVTDSISSTVSAKVATEVSGKYAGVQGKLSAEVAASTNQSLSQSYSSSYTKTQTMSISVNSVYYGKYTNGTFGAIYTYPSYKYRVRIVRIDTESFVAKKKGCDYTWASQGISTKFTNYLVDESFIPRDTDLNKNNYSVKFESYRSLNAWNDDLYNVNR